MSSLYESANTVVKTEKSSFPDLTGRIALNAAQIAERYPDGITIIGFGYWKNGELIPVLFKESADHFHWAGKVLSSIINKWLEGGKTPEQVTEQLALEGGVKVKLRIGKNKKNQDCTFVELVPTPNAENNLPF